MHPREFWNVLVCLLSTHYYTYGMTKIIDQPLGVFFNFFYLQLCSFLFHYFQRSYNNDSCSVTMFAVCFHTCLRLLRQGLMDACSLCCQSDVIFSWSHLSVHHPGHQSPCREHHACGASPSRENQRHEQSLLEARAIKEPLKKKKKKQLKLTLASHVILKRTLSEHLKTL